MKLVEPDYKVISVIGDSIAAGYFDRTSSGWVNSIIKRLDKDIVDGIYTRNFAVPGHRTLDCLSMFRSQVVPLPGDALIIACGINDLARWGDRESVQSIAPSVCMEAWQALLTEAKRIFEHIFVVEILPVYEERIPARENDFGDLQFYRNDDIDAYNKKIQKMCAKHQVSFISFKETLRQTDWNKCLFDDVHPNAEGHKIIADVMYQAVAKEML